MKYKIVDDPGKLFIKCPQNLAKKIHVPKKPNCQYSFILGKLGKSMWKDKLERMKFSDFNFFDPENYECPTEYNSLFDPYLRNYFSRKNVQNHLQKNGLITDKKEVICSIDEFNHYRKCLHRLKTEYDNDKKKYSYQNKLNSDNDENVSNYNSVKFESMLKNVIDRKKEFEKARSEKFQKIVKNYEDKLEKINMRKQLRNSKICKKGTNRDMEIIKKRIFVLETLRDRRNKIKKSINEKDKISTKQMNVEPVNYIIRCPIKF